MEEKIYFSDENIFSKISEILENNGVQESPEEAAFKFKEEKSFIGVIFNLSKDIIKGKISEKDFCSFLQSQLKIPKKSAENILKEVKTKILPLAEKIKIANRVESNMQEGAPITAKSARLINEIQKDADKPTIKNLEEAISKPSEINKLEEKPKSSGPDKYRESIE